MVTTRGTLYIIIESMIEPRIYFLDKIESLGMFTDTIFSRLGRMAAGTILENDDVAIKSPGDGLPPYELDNIIGKKLLKDLREEENFSKGILE